MRSRLLRSALWLVLVVGLLCLFPGCGRNGEGNAAGGSANAGGPGGTGNPTPTPTPVEPLAASNWTGEKASAWQDVERLINEQKFEEAYKGVEAILEKARGAGNGEEQTRSLIKLVQLRSALHGFETSVRFLKEQAWPRDLLSQSVLNLYYASSLTDYARAYSWEIRKREKVDSKGAVDLKAWTLDEIYAEAQRAYAQVFAHRDELGKFPVKVLLEYVSPNNYPAEIRPTLRDAVSYLYVELLSDTSLWRPEQSAETYRLNLAELLGASGASGKNGPALPDLADPGVHPLVKTSAILADLETWHHHQDQAEAAFEARLERLRRLNASFTEAADRDTIKKDLEARLPGIRPKPWWSMGMAFLSELVQQEDTPDNLVRARKIALDGKEAYPASIGGQRCNHILFVIESPAYQMEAMMIDAPGKRSIGIQAKNLPAVFFRAYPVDIKKFIENAKDWGLYPNNQELARIMQGSRPAHAWKADLPPTPDYKMHRLFVTPPMQEPGMYAVVASARESFTPDSNQMTAAFVTIGDLVLTVRQEQPEVEAMVLSGSTGRPVAGAEVLLYSLDWQKGHRVAETAVTGQDGIVRFKPPANNPWESHVLLARKDRQVAFDPTQFNFGQRGERGFVSASFIYTDRSIYRPGQKILFKVVAYSGNVDQGQYKTAADTSVQVTLRDANHQNVETRSLTTNKFGSASGEFVVPSGRLLGQWNLLSSWNGSAAIRIEEYKRPTFEAKFKDPEAPLRLNRPAVLKGEARYYFGLPVASGKIQYRVTREPVYPWWWGWYWWGGGAPNTRAQTITAGTAALKEDGTFTLEFTPEADERLALTSKGITYRYAITADVTDEGGETRSATRSVRLGFVAVEAAVRADKDFFLDDQPISMTIARTDLDGAPAAGNGRYEVFALRQGERTLVPADQPVPVPPEPSGPKPYRTPDDLKRSRWEPGYSPDAVLRLWESGDRKSDGALTHDAKGEAAVKLPALAPGAYRLRYETTDPFGAEYETTKEFIVTAPKLALNLPAIFEAEKNSVAVGETARFLAHSGLSEQLLYVDIYRDGRRVERRVLEAGTDAAVIEIPVKEVDRGGFSVTLAAVRDHQFMTFAESIYVPWDNKQLTVDFATFRDKLTPGAKETWTVKVSGPAAGAGPAAGKDTAAAATELLAYMYDRSLDVFAPHNPPSPMSAYPTRTGYVALRAAVGQAQSAWIDSNGFPSAPGYPTLNGENLRFYDSYGIGGPGHRRYRGDMAMEGVPMMAPPAPAMQATGRMMAKSEVSVSGGMANEEVAADTDEALKEKKSLDDASGGKGAGEAQAAPEVQMRSDFSETAFFEPHLLAGADGSASIQFTVPDSVTSWKVWVHAITDDLKSGSVMKEARSVKDLMVRPYVPRFLREGDKAELKIVVNNASDAEMKGTVAFDILDPATEKSILAEFGHAGQGAWIMPFTSPAGGGTNLTFPITTPARVGQIAVKVTAVSGRFSDGELRPLPILPGRMHLAQSRFVTLKDKARREMVFADLAKNDDPTLINEQLVVTLDAQLFYSVLSALPYLVNYPYECTEQLLNRFLCTGIMSSMYDEYPAVKSMAEKFKARETQYEQWDQQDPNRKMALEETPWVQMAKGGAADPNDLINVLDPKIAAAQRDSALAKLKKAQTSIGAFPWFPGGPPSPYMTLYILYGFSKGLEFGVDAPRPEIERAWGYLHRHYIDEVVKDMMSHDCCWEFVTFLNYTLSNYPDTSWTGGVFTDQERTDMLNFSFRHWKEHSPFMKGYLALTLKRMGRTKDALLVWESVMDSAKTAEDQGTFWAPEDRGWLWYNDSIETHAFAVRTELEIKPQDPKLDGLVLWLFLNKKLNHWKSTRATAEVVYSLIHYLKQTQQLGVREEATVTVGDLTKQFTFEPTEYTGKKNQIVIPGPEVDPVADSKVVVEKSTPGYLFASATWHFSTERLPEEDRGDYLMVSRAFFKRVKTGREISLVPLKEGAALEPGDEVEVQISITSKHPMEYVHLRDPRPAGCEPVSLVSSHKWDLGIYWYEEVRDSGMNFFFEHLPQGQYTFKHRIRAAMAGTFKIAPATIQPMYAPEFTAYSAGAIMTIQGAAAAPGQK